MGKLFAGAMLALGLSVGGVGLASPGTASAHEAGTDGCTLSPDWSYVPVYYNFHNACDRHDLCYINKPHGTDGAGRKACDDAFRTDMRTWCNSYYRSWWQSPARTTCRGVAEVYYQAVRTFGGAFF